MIHTKICSKCNLEKNTTDFYKATSRTKDGLRLECKLCWKIACKHYHDNNKEQRKFLVRDQHYKRNYGISSEEFDELVEKNKGICPICKKKKKLVLDHCHDTGKVRDTICSSCNHGLGCAKDNIEILENMIAYLGTH